MPLQRLALRAAVVCALLSASPSAQAWEGTVSFYGAESGRVTANGERFRPGGDRRRVVRYGCAHWTLAFNTIVRVTDLATGRSVECRVNDRGPNPRLHRTLDLVRGAAEELGIIRRGVIRARLAIVRAPGAGRLRLAGLR